MASSLLKSVKRYSINGVVVTQASDEYININSVVRVTPLGGKKILNKEGTFDKIEIYNVYGVTGLWFATDKKGFDVINGLV